MTALTPGKKAAMTLKKNVDAMSPAQRAARTRKLRSAGRKAAATRKRKAAGRKAAETRKANKLASQGIPANMVPSKKELEELSELESIMRLHQRILKD